MEKRDREFGLFDVLDFEHEHQLQAQLLDEKKGTR
jgi:hypothetical protein